MFSINFILASYLGLGDGPIALKPILVRMKKLEDARAIGTEATLVDQPKGKEAAFYLEAKPECGFICKLYKQ